MRVYQFAKELGKDSGDFVHELQSNFGFDIKSHLSGITEEQMQKVRDFYDKKNSTDMDQEEIDLKVKLMNQDLEVRLKELEKKDASPKISDMIGKDDESELHHKEAMKERFNVDNSIKTHVETAKSAREQYAKTVSKISDDPQEWSNINNIKKQQVELEDSLFVKFLNWITGK